MLTGDTLFVGDVARPDLAIEKSEGARGIFRSLNGKLLGARRRRRGLARPPRRLDVRRPGDGHEGLLDDRLRAAPQPGAGDRRRGRVRRAGAGRARPAAAELPRDRRAQPRPAADRRRRAAAAGAAPGRAAARRRRDAGRRPHRPAVRRRPHPRRGVRSRCSTPASAPSSPGSPTASRRSSSSGATTRTAAQAGRLAVAVGIRRLAGFLHGGHDELAPGEAPGRTDRPPAAGRAAGARRRRPDPRRARAERVGRGPHPGLASSSPGTTSTGCPTASTRRGRSPSSAARASARRSRPASSSATAPRR